MTRELTGDGRMLPPDWAELTAAGVLAGEPAPDGSQPQTQYGLDAERVTVWFAVLPLVATAAAAGAAGQAGMTSRLLSQAAVQQRDHPTYYGGAWDALGAALLTSGTLGGCRPG